MCEYIYIYMCIVPDSLFPGHEELPNASLGPPSPGFNAASRKPSLISALRELSMYIYIYVRVCRYTCTYIYTYVYIHMLMYVICAYRDMSICIHTDIHTARPPPPKIHLERFQSIRLENSVHLCTREKDRERAREKEGVHNKEERQREQTD